MSTVISPVTYQQQIEARTSPLQFPADAFIKADMMRLKKNNIDLNQANNRIIQAQSLYQQAYARYYPQITAGFRANRQRFVNPLTFTPQEEITLLSLNGGISLVPDIFGRTKLRTNIARNQVMNDYLRSQMVYLQTLNRYARNYNLLCATQSLVEINQATVELNNQREESAKLRYQLGRLNVVDYYNAQDQTKTALGALQQARQNHNLARQSYYTLIGQSMNLLQEQKICQTGFVDLPTAHLEITLQALDQRPDIIAARQDIEIAKDNVDLSLKAFYPDTEILFSFQTTSQKLAKLIDPELIASQLIGNIGQLIFDGGARDAQIVASKANLKLAQQTYQNLLVSAINEVVTLSKNFVQMIKQQQTVQQRQKLARKALDAAQRSYNNGTIDFRQLLQIQANFYAAQIAYIGAQQMVRDTYTDLLTASAIAPINLVNLESSVNLSSKMHKDI